MEKTDLGRGDHTLGEPELCTARGKARAIRRASSFWPRIGPRLPARQAGLALPVSAGPDANLGWAELLTSTGDKRTSPRAARRSSARPGGPAPHHASVGLFPVSPCRAEGAPAGPNLPGLGGPRFPQHAELPRLASGWALRTGQLAEPSGRCAPDRIAASAGQPRVASTQAAFTPASVAYFAT